MNEVDYITVTGWSVWKGHAIPIPVAKYIAEQVNELLSAKPDGEPIARVINDNQPGNTVIIEVLCSPPTLTVGTELFAKPVLSQPVDCSSADTATAAQLRELFSMEDDEELEDVIRTHDGVWCGNGKIWHWSDLEELSLDATPLELLVTDDWFERRADLDEHPDAAMAGGDPIGAEPLAWWAETGTAGKGEGCNKPFWLEHEAAAYVRLHGGYIRPLFTASILPLNQGRRGSYER